MEALNAGPGDRLDDGKVRSRGQLEVQRRWVGLREGKAGFRLQEGMKREGLTERPWEAGATRAHDTGLGAVG